MKVVLLAHTPTPEQTVAAAARLCYSDTDVEALRGSPFRRNVQNSLWKCWRDSVTKAPWNM